MPQTLWKDLQLYSELASFIGKSLESGDFLRFERRKRAAMLCHIYMVLKESIKSQQMLLKEL